ncbi:solute carrier family 6 (neurotransmitter transporter, taurine) member 6 [Sarotherodon galilaeus]
MTFKLNQATLFFIQLLVIWHVFAEVAEEGNRTVFASIGHSVTLTCNISKKNATSITWTNNRSVFRYSIALNRNFSNFSSHRLKINHEFPTKLIIFSAQSEDEGLYKCSIIDKSGLNSITWNLTVSESPKESTSSKTFLYILPPAIGFLLCGTMLAICFCRKVTMRTPNLDPVKNSPQSGEEAALPQPQGANHHCECSKRRSQYMERWNSIYDHF